MAGRAGGLDVDRNANRHARERVLEGQIDRRLEVAPSLPARLASGVAAATEQVPEQVAEVEVDVAEGVRVEPVAGGEPALTALVVLLPLLGVAEHVVGALDLLEAILGLLVAGVLVGVIGAGEFAVRLLDLVLRRCLRDVEHLVEALRAHSAASASSGCSGSSGLAEMTTRAWADDLIAGRP